MATLITKNSSTASSVPTAAQLVQGELAVNVTDKRLFTENSSGTVVELGTNPSTLALPNGTANGVAYLNGSKVLTTGSALTFDGANLGIGGSAPYYLTVNAPDNNGALIKSGNDSHTGFLYFGDTASNTVGAVSYDHSNNSMRFQTGGSEQARLTSTGLGIGTSSPSYKLSVNSGASTTIGLFTSTGSSAYLGLANSGATTYIGNDSTSGSFIIQTPSSGFSTKLTLDNPGNLGLGVTPSGWATYFSAVQAGNASKGGAFVSAGGFSVYGSNYYEDVSGVSRYVNSTYALKYATLGNGTHAWFTAPSGTAGNAISFTQAMTLDASGNLQLGTTGSAGRMHIAVPFSGSTATSLGDVSKSHLHLGDPGYNNQYCQITFGYDTTNSAAAIGYTSTDANGNTKGAIVFATRDVTTSTLPTERARITSGGDVGIGTTSPAVRLHVDSSGGGIVRVTRLASSAGAYGQLEHDGTNTTLTSSAATIFNAGGATERARITSGGAFLVGGTSVPVSYSGSRFYVAQSAADYSGAFDSTSSTAANNYGLLVKYTAATPNGTGNHFYRAEDATGARFLVRSNGGIENYSANDVNLSDRREKTNLAPAKSYLDTICAIPVQTFNYIDQSEDDPGLTLGVVAQDVQAVAPELVMESNWGTEDNPKMRLSIYQTDLQYALMKALQELKAEFDAYKATHP